MKYYYTKRRSFPCLVFSEEFLDPDPGGALVGFRFGSGFFLELDPNPLFKRAYVQIVGILNPKQL